MRLKKGISANTFLINTVDKNIDKPIDFRKLFKL